LVVPELLFASGLATWGLTQVVEELNARMHGGGDGDGYVQVRGELDDCAGHALVFELLACLEVLQHRGFVVTDRQSGLQSPVQGHREGNAEQIGYGGTLGEDSG
jgi:hypothetical protein